MAKKNEQKMTIGLELAIKGGAAGGMFGMEKGHKVALDPAKYDFDSLYANLKRWLLEGTYMEMVIVVTKDDITQKSHKVILRDEVVGGQMLEGAFINEDEDYDEIISWHFKS